MEQYELQSLTSETPEHMSYSPKGLEEAGNKFSMAAEEIPYDSYREKPSSSSEPIIQLKDIYKTYKMGGTEVHACAGINLNIYKGEFIVIMGPSGSGKSTMMNIIGCLDRPTSGSYNLDGKEVSLLSDDELAVVRNQKIGFIFQKFHLLAGSSSGENVELPMIYAGVNSRERRHMSVESLTKVGLGDRINHNPNELSGGQMQRVAIARSLVNRPAILLADEPTGNLDSKSGAEIMALFQELHSQGRTVVLITHNPEVARYGTRVVELKDGQIISDKHIHESERVILTGENNGAKITGTVTIKGRMNFFQSFKVAWNALRVNKVRSLLTMLGIIIGVAAVIVMTSIGEGTKYNVMQQIYSLGTNVIFVRPGTRDNVIRGSIESESRRLTLKDAEALEKGFILKGVAPQISRNAVARYRSNNLTATMIGTTTDYFYVRNFPLDKGRYFSDEELTSRAPVCVIGSYVAEQLFEEGENPIGKLVKLSASSSTTNNKTVLKGGLRLTVIGVLQSKGKTFGEDNDRQVVVPMNTVLYRLFNTKYISVIYVEAPSAEQVQDTVNEVKRLLVPLHNNDPNNLNINSQEDILARASATTGALTFMLAGIAFVSLLVGGIGIMNIMLVSVTERTREIGLRKAIGARKNDILFQFLIEALVLGITGGIIGILLGLGLSNVYTYIAASSALKMLSKTFISINSIILSFSFSALVGIFFGLYPARKAASLDPIDALRYE
ncbi:MAG: ABC transporter permease [Candidatus Eremiobacterota bacterium]